MVLPLNKINYSLGVVLVTIVLIGCNKDNFKWETKKKNTIEFLEEKDSILVIDGVSNDPQYGYSPKKPIKLGVTKLNLGATYPEKYFKALRSPENKGISFRRIKSCCPFKTVNSPQYQFNHLAVLEIYELTYENQIAPVRVYINFFDQDQKILAPKGFTFLKFK